MRAHFRVIGQHLQETYHIPRPQLANVYSNLADLNLVYPTRQLQIYPHAFDERFEFVGPFLGARAEAPDFPFDALGDQPVIYMSLGTDFNDKAEFYRLLF